MKKASAKSATPKPKKEGPRSSAHGVCWNLGDLYKDLKDKQIESHYQTALKRAREFEKKYKGKLAPKPKLSGKQLGQMVQEYEEILMLRDRPHIYAHLLFASDTQNPDYGRKLREMQNRSTEITKHLIFVDLEWCAVADADAKKLLADAAVKKYRHYLEASRRYKPHLLSEAEEKVIDEIENTGSRAFTRLFDELLGAMNFTVKVKGETRTMSEQEALSLLYNPDRDTRQAAAQALTEGFKAGLKPITFIFNTLVDHHTVVDRLRSYADPMASRNLSNDIEPKTVDALLKTCDANTGLVSRYYKLKAKLLGLKKLYDYDRYAPISADMPSCSWAESKELIIDAYREFSPELGRIVEEFYRKNWIDAELRPGKRGGAFCAGTTPDVHPYILTNYSDKLRDAVTMAHELGHGVHQYLSRKQGYLQSDTPLTLAETASVFGEMLTFHRLMGRQTNPAVKLALLCSKIEDAFATVFRQACMTRFEQKLHAARRKEGELTPETIGKFWMETNRAMFGDSVDLTDNYSFWWCYIPHFIHTPFYCYAYSFGELLVLSLYARYRKEGKSFVPKYLELLASGGSDNPVNLVKKMGLDIAKPSFWQDGMNIIEEMLTEAEHLAGVVAKGGVRSSASPKVKKVAGRRK